MNLSSLICLWVGLEVTLPDRWSCWHPILYRKREFKTEIFVEAHTASAAAATRESSNSNTAPNPWGLFSSAVLTGTCNTERLQWLRLAKIEMTHFPYLMNSGPGNCKSFQPTRHQESCWEIERQLAWPRSLWSSAQEAVKSHSCPTVRMKTPEQR